MWYRKGPVTRSLALLFAALVLLAVGYVVVSQKPQGAPVSMPASAVSSAGVRAPEPNAPPALTATAIEEPAGLGGAPPAASTDDVAPLASGAPRQVVFGVALVWYRGAQSAPAGARSREEASALAASIAEEAKKDFASAVKRADSGFENAGSIQRTVLEGPAESLLFSLGVGEVGGPVDSPRGFYVFRRIE